MGPQAVVVVPEVETEASKTASVDCMGATKTAAVAWSDEAEKPSEGGHAVVPSVPTGHGIGHMRHELALRWPYYRSDWSDGCSFKVLAATCYMFCASIAPAITLGAFLLMEVEDQMGPIEVLLSTAICGVTFSVVAGQGLVIVGVTGPVCIFSATVYKWSKDLDFPFLQWMGWIAIWACFMHLALAITGACRFVSHVTRYACETFGSLIGTIYVYTAMADLVRFFRDERPASALLCVILCLGTHMLAEAFAGARGWSLFNKTLREALASYAVPLSMLIWTLVSILARDTSLGVDVPRIRVAETFAPTISRPWLVDLGNCPVAGIFSAIIPAFVLTVLFFFDHNVSSLMSQAPKFNLKKPSAYNWDFFVVGILILVCGVLGLPFTNGLIPQAPLHVEALATYEERKAKDGSTRSVVVHVAEQRVSNCVHALAIGLCCTPPVLKLLQTIPLSVLSGLFLYMGLSSFVGNGFVARMLLPIRDPKRRSPELYGALKSLLSTGKGIKEVAFYTFLQFFLWGAIFGVTFTPAAISFPLLIAALVLVRWRVLPCFFSDDAIQRMDGEEHQDVEEMHE